MRSFIKIFGPPVLQAIKALEKVAITMPEVCIMDTVLLRNIPSSLDQDLGGYRRMETRQSWVGNYYYETQGLHVPIERCESIISNSGESLGDYDFFFEWYKEPDQEQILMLIEKIDEALTNLGCYYTITSK
jgi:hypothetical protein